MQNQGYDKTECKPLLLARLCWNLLQVWRSAEACVQETCQADDPKGVRKRADRAPGRREQGAEACVPETCEADDAKLPGGLVKALKDRAKPQAALRRIFEEQKEQEAHSADHLPLEVWAGAAGGTHETGAAAPRRKVPLRAGAAGVSC